MKTAALFDSLADNAYIREAELKRRGGSKWLQQILAPAKTVTSEKK